MIKQPLKQHFGKSNPFYGKKHTKNNLKKMSESTKRMWRNEKYREHFLKIIRSRKTFSESHKRKMSESAKRRWKNPKYRNKEIKRLRKIGVLSVKGLMKRPTSLEQRMIDIIKKHNLPYRYTGDGQFLIGYKNPDFVNVNGEKICIEVANIFHHKEDYPQKRKTHFKKWGWDCIVFRGDELNENEVLRIVKNKEDQNKQLKDETQ